MARGKSQNQTNKCRSHLFGQFPHKCHTRHQQFFHDRDDPSISALDTADDLRLSQTINRVFSKKKLFANLTGKDSMLKEVQDCVLRKDGEKLNYINSYWRDMSVKHWTRPMTSDYHRRSTEFSVRKNSSPT